MINSTRVAENSTTSFLKLLREGILNASFIHHRMCVHFEMLICLICTHPQQWNVLASCTDAALPPFVSGFVVIGGFICSGSYVFCKLATAHQPAGFHPQNAISSFLHHAADSNKKKTLPRTLCLFGCHRFAQNKSFLHKHFGSVSSTQTFAAQMRNTYSSLWACAIQSVGTAS